MGAEIVDIIAARLEVQLGNYVTNFEKASAAHERFTRTRPDKAGSFTTAEIQQYSNRHKEAGDVVAVASEKVSRAVKRRSADEIAADRASAAAAKQAAKERAQAAKDAADAEVREAQRSARLRAVADRAVSRQGIVPATGGRIGAIVPREGTGQRSIPTAVLNGAASEVAAEAEVNHLLADRFDLQQRSRVAEGAVKRELQDEVAYLLRINTYKRAGLTEDEAILRAEREIVAIQKLRSINEEKVAVARKGGLGGANQFALSATQGRFGYSFSPGAVAGVALAAGVAVGTEVISSAAEYGKELQNVSKQLGLTTDQLQIYQAAARETGATDEQLRSGLASLTENLGKARTGGQEQAKVFKALGVDIRGATTAGDLLPILIDRLSSIQDASKRATAGQILFGDTFKNLEGLLSRGNDRINDLAEALIRTGAVLSGSDIARLGEVSKRLEEVKAQLRVDYAEIVAGNSDAILSLASSFRTLVNDIREAISWIGAYNSQKLNDLTGGKVLAPDFIANSQTAYEKLFRRGAAFVGGQLGATSPQADVMTDEARASLIRFRATPTQSGEVNQALLNKLNAPKPPKGKSAEQLENEESQRKRRFNDIMGRYEDEQQRAVAEQTQSEYERSDIEKRQIDRDLAREKEDLRLRSEEDIRKGANRKITEARLAQATSAAEAAAAERKNVIALRDTIEGLNRDAAARRRSLDMQSDLLQDADGLARTQAERRRIAASKRENDRAKETNDANLIISRAEQGDPTVSTTDLQDARNKIATQDRRFASRARLDNASTAGPIEAYQRGIARTPEQIKERFEQAAVQGVDRLNDSLTDTAAKFLHLNGLAGDFLKSLIRIGVERFTADAIFGRRGGDGSSTAAAGLAEQPGDSAKSLKSLLSLIPGIGGLFGHRASGGNVVGGNSYLVGERGPEIVNFGQSGRVYPNGALPSVASPRAGNTLHQTFHIDASGVNPDGYAAGIIQQVRQETVTAIRQSSAATLDATPARIQQISVLGT